MKEEKPPQTYSASLYIFFCGFLSLAGVTFLIYQNSRLNDQEFRLDRMQDALDEYNYFAEHLNFMHKATNIPIGKLENGVLVPNSYRNSKPDAGFVTNEDVKRVLRSPQYAKYLEEMSLLLEQAKLEKKAKKK